MTTWETFVNETGQWLVLLVLALLYFSLAKRLDLHSRRMDRTDDRITLQQGQINAYRARKE